MWTEDANSTTTRLLPAAAQDSETESEADQQNDGEAAEAETETDTQPVEEYTLKHLGEEQKVNREEVIALAQQGLDYARIKDKLHTAEAEKSEIAEKLSFFEKLAEKQNQTLDEFVEATAASLRADEKRISYDEALREVRFEFEKSKFGLAQLFARSSLSRSAWDNRK